MAPQKQQLQPQANKLSKTLKQQEIRALKTHAGPQNAYTSDRRQNSGDYFQ